MRSWTDRPSDDLYEDRWERAVEGSRYVFDSAGMWAIKPALALAKISFLYPPYLALLIQTGVISRLKEGVYMARSTGERWKSESRDFTTLFVITYGSVNTNTVSQ